MQSVKLRGQAARGQALTEFAIVAPIFFILIFGVIQFGIIFGGQIGLANAAREVARFASTVPPNTSSAAIATQADAVVRRSIPGYNGSAVVTSSYCYYPNSTTATTPQTTYSWKVTVSIRYGHSLFIPLVGVLVDRIDGVADNRFTTGVQEEMRVETLPLKSVPTGTACVGANP